MSAEMMKNMSKEDMEKMQAMAGSARSAGATGPATGGAAGGAAPPANMAEMLNNPEAMSLLGRGKVAPGQRAVRVPTHLLE